mmetsp:Transcript_12542/g.32435  ORF Transcript_12542/g.32435 Transcript_12542/m.32435 type:complete len:225 (+) Transcript_12542:322-996(+)
MDERSACKSCAGPLHEPRVRLGDRHCGGEAACRAGQTCVALRRAIAARWAGQRRVCAALCGRRWPQLRLHRGACRRRRRSFRKAVWADERACLDPGNLPDAAAGVPHRGLHHREPGLLSGANAGLGRTRHRCRSLGPAAAVAAERGPGRASAAARRRERRRRDGDARPLLREPEECEPLRVAGRRGGHHNDGRRSCGAGRRAVPPRPVLRQSDITYSRARCQRV